MPNFCTKHLLPFTFGDKCPKCLESEVKAQPYAKETPLKNRWTALTAKPAELNQDQFGICGMASAVYLLLRHNQPKAQELFDATFADIIPQNNGKVFNTANHEPIEIPFRYLARRYRLMEEAKAKDAPNRAQQLIKDEVAKMQNKGVSQQDIANWTNGLDLGKIEAALRLSGGFLVDFCVSRGLGYVFKEVAKSRYEGEKRQFNLEFSQPQPIKDYRNFTHNGNLALRTNNLAFILQDILGAVNIHVASRQGLPAKVKTPCPLAPEVKGVTCSTFKDTNELTAAFNARLVGNKDFAVAAVYSDIVDSAQNGKGYEKHKSVGDKNDTLTYNHWIVINGFKDVTRAPTTYNKPNKPKHVELKIWTWAQDLVLHVREDKLPSYIQDVIFGKI
jgi:hypothetical protein